MKRKQIPFSLEMVKKIQAGEVKGFIKTRDGRIARFIGKIHDNRYPLVFASALESGTESVLCNTINGLSYYGGGQSDDDIIIEIEEPKQECQFKPFDKVLVRDEDSEEWKANFFSRYDTNNIFKYECLIGAYAACIPYAGNENLLGTTDKPKEDRL